jgi:hypothetical protein
MFSVPFECPNAPPLCDNKVLSLCNDPDSPIANLQDPMPSDSLKKREKNDS